VFEFVLKCREDLETELMAFGGSRLGVPTYSTLSIIIDTDCSQLVAVVREDSQDRSPYLH
jgi:hypothetical protein